MKTLSRFIIVCIVSLFFIDVVNAGQIMTEELEDSFSIMESKPVPARFTSGYGQSGWRVAFGGGYAYRLAERIDQGSWELNDMQDKLMHGFNVMADIQYFVQPLWGFGLTTNMVRANTKGENVYVPGVGTASLCKESHTFFFIAPSFAIKGDFRNFSIIGDAAIGPLVFWNTVNINNYQMNGSRATAGFYMGAAFEGKISPTARMGVKLSYTVGTIPSMTLNGPFMNSKIDERISLSNFMVTAFISFRSR